MTSSAKAIEPVIEEGGREPVSRWRVWDLPIRMFHWTLVLLLGASWWTAEQSMLEWHRVSGYCILALVLFRLLWGVFGSTTARFTGFVKGPMAVVRYARNDMFSRKASVAAGHNPLGGWSVVLMLAALLGQTLLGLFAVDIDGMESGPLATYVSFDTGRLAAEIHGALFNILLALIALHILAIAFYMIVKRTDLLTPMILGWTKKQGSSSALHFPPVTRAILLLAICGAAVWGMVKLTG